MIKWLDTINDFLNRHLLDNSRLLVVPLGLLGLIGFPLFSIVYIKTQDLWLNGFGTLSSLLILACYRSWFIHRKYLPIFWFIWVTYCLPFDFTHDLLANHTHFSYQLGEIVALMILAITISNIFLMLCSLLLGVGIAIVSTSTSLYNFFPHSGFDRVWPYYLLGITFSIIIMRFRLKGEKERASISERNKTMQILTASIAHELRTPFASAEGIAQTLQQSMPKLLQEDSAPSDKNNQKLSKAMLSYLRKKDLGNSLSGVVKRAHTFVNMMQQKINYGDLSDPENQEVFSVLPQIQEALDNYAMEPEEAERVVPIKDHDFKAKGTPLLLQHVILNLLKNALHYTHSKDDAKIEIWLENGDQTNQIHFKDTGQGINSEDLPHIFEAFFSKTVHGTGVGLAFCKMVIERNFKGDITCVSELGNYTHFVVELPNVDGVSL